MKDVWDQLNEKDWLNKKQSPVKKERMYADFAKAGKGVKKSQIRQSVTPAKANVHIRKAGRFK